LHQQATDRLIEVRLGSKSSSEFFVQFMGPVPSFLGLEPQLLGHSAREQGEEKSQHYRSRDLLYCGVSLRQPRPRLHPKNAHTRSLAENALTARAGYPAPHNHTTICFGLIAALTNGTDRQSFQYRGCNHSLRALRLTGRKGSSQFGTKNMPAGLALRRPH
jgi:hypothetical protein